VQRHAAMHIAIYLALHPHGASKDELLEEILGDKTMRSASQSFDSSAYQLRRALTHPVEGNSALQRYDSGKYYLDPDFITVDWWQLQEAAETGDHHRVIDLYRDPLARGVDHEWLTGPREHARNLVLTAYDHLIDATENQEQALEMIETAIRIDPYNEHFYQRAMRIHADRGNRAGARRVLQRLKSRLATIGVEPNHYSVGLAALPAARDLGALDD
jgi:two-component SAPR family response regulator